MVPPRRPRFDQRMLLLRLGLLVLASTCTGCFTTFGTLLGAATEDYRPTEVRGRGGVPDPSRLVPGERVVIETTTQTIDGAYIGAEHAPPRRVELVVYTRSDDGGSPVERRIALEDVKGIEVWRHRTYWGYGLVAGLVLDIVAIAVLRPQVCCMH